MQPDQTSQSGATLQDRVHRRHGSTVTHRQPQVRYQWTTTYLVEPNIITEVRVSIQLDITAVGRPSALEITAEYMYDTMLDFFGDVGKVHIVSATRGAFYLKFVSVVLVEPLETFYEEEVHGQP